MRELTLILPYYRNPSMLRKQQETWRAFPDDLKAALHVIVVDDGSPKERAKASVVPTGIASFRLYRTDTDIRWNWLFCRNLGMQESATEWNLLTDIDHLLPEWTLRRLLEGELDARKAYRFSRVDAPLLTPYKPHPNTWLLTRDLFDRIGGYDERFSGYYGTDGEFRDRVTAKARAIVLLPEPMIRVSRDVITDASTTHYGRKETIDQENVARIREERARVAGWRPERVKLTDWYLQTAIGAEETVQC